MERDDSWNVSDFLGEDRPSSDPLFQTGTGVELNQTLTEGEPVIHSPLDDVIRDIHPQYNRTALVWKLPRFTTGIILWPAEKEWAGFDVHGETIFPCLATGLLEVRIRSVLQDLLRTISGCTMQ
jgi:hypothetical protein